MTEKLFPADWVQNGLLVGAPHRALAFTPPPAEGGMLVWRDGRFEWSRVPETGVRSVAVSVGEGLAVAGSPIPSGQSGVIHLSLADTGVAEGDYYRVTVDRLGRVVAGAPLVARDVITALGFTPIAEEGEVYAAGGDIWGSGRRDRLLLELVPSGVAEGTYERVVVDAKGRVIAGLAPSNRRVLIRLGGDVSGIGTDEIDVALNPTGVVPGTYGRVAVDAQGRVHAGLPDLAPRPIQLVGDATGSVVGSVMVVKLGITGVEPGTYSKVLVDPQGRVRAGFALAAEDVTAALGFEPLTSITVAGDVEGKGGASLALRLSPTGVVPGTYARVAVDATGRVFAGLAAEPSTETLATVLRRGATADRAIRVSADNPSVSPDSGALSVAGGVGIGGALNVAGGISSPTLAIGRGRALAALHWRGNSAGDIAEVDFAPAIAIPLGEADNFRVVLGDHAVLLDPVGGIPGQRGVIWIEQDEVGGRSLAYARRWMFPNGAAPALPLRPRALSALFYSVGPRGQIAVHALPNLHTPE